MKEVKKVYLDLWELAGSPGKKIIEIENLVLIMDVLQLNNMDEMMKRVDRIRLELQESAL